MNTVYISDLDGTLLGNNAILSSFSKKVLDQLLQQGLQFTVASARSVFFMQTMLKGLNLRLPVIEFNGAFISDFDSGRHEIINSISPDVVESIYKLILEFGCVPFVSSFNGIEDCAYYKDVINDGMLWYLNDRLISKDPRWRAIEDLTHSFSDLIVCLTVIGHAQQLLELQGAIIEIHGTSVETHLMENQYSPGWYWLTIHDCKATKDQAIQTMVENYGLEESEIVVFGDQINDIKMFKVADRAIAVANADAQLKSYATLVIGSNTEDSVVKYIHQDWSNRCTVQLDCDIR
ncbi:Cof-type HAD-IIB family hydrolase [Desmonostoc muscorum LEGE 12446]|uniref:HAD family phosphatase n=1 Tax=Desmonostoc muscorum LEGE 12446 TaxID=1828758 RepID=A0A8J7DC63_DESMC|nr:HAD family hydrolase [Desmonostoc muscorum]MCF2147024.1 Cof-type HAD-IIB family hydrolase [Desmonostoc muscorum LEGE 12446]